MFRNLVLSAAAAGLAAGLFTAALQHVTTTPIIIQAERYEAEAQTADAAPHHHDIAGQTGSTSHSHSHEHDRTAEGGSWVPEDGVERTVYTSLSTAVIGFGFALTLLGAMVVAGVPIHSRTGLAFGIAGFATVALAPALGLPPELPGSGSAALQARQIWWFCTAAATAGGSARCF